VQTKLSMFLVLEPTDPPPALPGITPVWRLGPLEKGRLPRVPLPPAVRGGALAITGIGALPDPEGTARELSLVCGRRGMGGVFWDLPADCDPGPAEALAPRLMRRGLWQLAPLHLARAVPQARVLVPSALSGGSFSELMERCQHSLAHRRWGLALEKMAARFPMPAPDPAGQTLTRPELEALLRQAGGQSWFSPDLCARYFTLGSGTDRSFVLFDDRESALRKLRMAAAAGGAALLVRYRDWGPDSASLLTGL